MSSPDTRLPRVALTALALLAFAGGAAEMVAIGFQDELAAQLDVSAASAGLLVTVYAASVAIGGPLLMLALTRFAPARTLTGLLLAFALAQVGAAVAPSLGWLLVARVPAGALMGAMFALGTVSAMRIAPRGREGAALGIVTFGLTTALVAGAPLGAALTQAAGWRATFWALAGVALVAAAGVAATARRFPAADPTHTDRALALAALRRPAVRRAVLTTAAVMPAVFAAYTYLTPMLDDVTKVSAGAATAVLLALGVGAMAGSSISGRLLDSSGTAVLRWALAGVVVSLVVLAAGATVPVVVLIASVAFGFAAFSAPTALQGTAIAAAGDAPLVASALNISAFNVANTIGAGLGGVAIAMADDARAPVILGAVLAGSALLALPSLLGTRVERTPEAQPI